MLKKHVLIMIFLCIIILPKSSYTLAASKTQIKVAANIQCPLPPEPKEYLI